MHACQIEFALTYFSFWPSFVCNVIAIISFHISHYAYHENSSTKLAGLCVFNLLVHVVTLFLIHLVLTKIGIEFVDKHVQHKDTLTSELLDLHKDRVVILDESSLDVLFISKTGLPQLNNL